MKEYQYKRVTVRAVVFGGDVESPELCELMAAHLINLNYVCKGVAVLCTTRGPKQVNIGDYIVQLPNGEFRAYTPQEFAEEFEDIPDRGVKV